MFPFSSSSEQLSNSVGAIERAAGEPGATPPLEWCDDDGDGDGYDHHGVSYVRHMNLVAINKGTLGDANMYDDNFHRGHQWGTLGGAFILSNNIWCVLLSPTQSSSARCDLDNPPRTSLGWSPHRGRMGPHPRYSSYTPNKGPNRLGCLCPDP